MTYRPRHKVQYVRAEPESSPFSAYAPTQFSGPPAGLGFQTGIDDASIELESEYGHPFGASHGNNSWDQADPEASEVPEMPDITPSRFNSQREAAFPEMPFRQSRHSSRKQNYVEESPFNPQFVEPRNNSRRQYHETQMSPLPIFDSRYRPQRSLVRGAHYDYELVPRHLQKSSGSRHRHHHHHHQKPLPQIEPPPPNFYDEVAGKLTAIAETLAQINEDETARQILYERVDPEWVNIPKLGGTQ